MLSRSVEAWHHQQPFSVTETLWPLNNKEAQICESVNGDHLPIFHSTHAFFHSFAILQSLETNILLQRASVSLSVLVRMAVYKC